MRQFVLLCFVAFSLALPLVGYTQTVQIQNMQSITSVAVLDKILLDERIEWQRMHFAPTTMTIVFSDAQERERLESALVPAFVPVRFTQPQVAQPAEVAQPAVRIWRWRTIAPTKQPRKNTTITTRQQ